MLERARAAGERAYPDSDYDLAMACWLLARVLQTAGGSEQALPLLDEARRGFEAIVRERLGKGAERMASVCLAEQGDCLRDLGRLDEAAAAYEENIQLAQKLGTVRLQQRRYRDALAAYQDARERFTALDEPGTVAAYWHQAGMAYQEAGQPEAAEDVYRQSLAIEVRLGNVAGQASTLGQLGMLYDNALGRTEEAVAFLRQAADKYVEIGDLAGEGRQRNNLAIRLHRLRRLDEARQEIRRKIESDPQFGHASQPWKTWYILADIETDAGDPSAAAQARTKARACYLAYRRDGGENHDAPGRIALTVTQPLLAGDSAAALSSLQQLAVDPEAAWLLPFIHALQSIADGSRDHTLAEAPELDFSMATEILILIETLESVNGE